MPLPVGTIAAGADILSTGINAILTSEQNRKNRKFAEQQAQQQRAWALEDYHMQNKYNSPAEQMERLKAAGLNPNLVYGNGATATGGNVRSTAPAQWEGKAPQIDGGAVGKYLQAQMMKLQSDNLKAQNNVLLEQAKNIAADTTSKLFGADLKEFDFNLKTQLRNNTISKAWQITKNLDTQGGLTAAQIANTHERTKTEVATREPKIQAILQNVSESMQRIINMKVQAAKSSAEISYIYTQLENAAKDGKLKDIDIQMKKYGVNWSDPMWQRKAAQALSLIGL